MELLSNILRQQNKKRIELKLHALKHITTVKLIEKKPTRYKRAIRQRIDNTTTPLNLDSASNH
jgi:hypothetical protein